MPPKIYGLIGFPLAHSFSVDYFTKKFIGEKFTGCIYQNFEIPRIEELKSVLLTENLLGFNVTIPYKKQIIPFLSGLDLIASKIGAVNCVKREGASLIGHNTDAFGFENALLPYLKPGHKKALVLGTGGASLAVRFVLQKLGIEMTSVSSTQKENTIPYQAINKEIIETHQLIINTTPLGTFPKMDEYPNLPYNFISTDHLCFDLIYNPDETLFLKKSKENGALILNGYQMLVLQAEESWRIWNEN